MSNKKRIQKPRQQSRPANVVVAYLHPSGSVGGRFHKCLLDLLVRDSFQPSRTVCDVIDMSSGANITTARNTIVRHFLNTSAEWLWMIDADMTFPPDVLDRLLESANPTERPIVGGLCFRVTQDQDRLPQLIPTLYGMNGDTPPRTVVYHDYPPETLVQVAATGAACLLVHRSVFEGMAAKTRQDGTPLFQRPWVWFAETLYPEYNDVLSEDITFCIRASACGFPVHVDTGVAIGHQKTIVATAELFQALKALQPTDLPETFVVIAGKDRHEMTANLLADLSGQDATVLLYDNGSDPPYDFPGVEIIPAAGWGLHEMWADGIKQARARAETCNIAVLNNDLRVKPDFLRKLGMALRARPDVWISYPDVHAGTLALGQVVPTQADGQTVCGYAFMLRGEAPVDLDVGFGWWYGDWDLEKQVQAAGKYVVTVGGVKVQHLEPTLSTRGERLEQAIADEARFAAKWGLDPTTLFLASHPEFGR